MIFTCWLRLFIAIEHCIPTYPGCRTATPGVRLSTNWTPIGCSMKGANLGWNNQYFHNSKKCEFYLRCLLGYFSLTSFIQSFIWLLAAPDTSWWNTYARSGAWQSAQRSYRCWRWSCCRQHSVCWFPSSANNWWWGSYLLNLSLCSKHELKIFQCLQMPIQQDTTSVSLVVPSL